MDTDNVSSTNNGNDDVEEMDMSFIPRSIEDTKESRELRRKYRQKKQDLEANRTFLEGKPDLLNEELEEIDVMFQQVKTTREAVLDSSLMILIANIAKDGVDKLSINTLTFDPIVFAEKLATKMAGRPMIVTIPDTSWEIHGKKSSKYFNKTPTFDYKLGLFERGETVYKQRRRGPSQREKDNEDLPVVQPAEISQSKELDQEETSEEVERILGILHLLHKRNDMTPIDFFEFIINPDSFGFTIENIFHVSFLVQNGTAKVYLDEDKLPVIEPTNLAAGSQVRQSKQKGNQIILRMTFPEWKEIKKASRIETPLIPPRS